MRRSSILFILLLSSAALVAQTATPAAQFTLPTPAIAQSCPVRLAVNREPQGAVVWTGSSNPVHHGQGLNISIMKAANTIVAADIVVYGYSAGTRIVPATSLLPKEVTETFHLTASTGHPVQDSTIWTEHLVMVNRIELTRIEYADGSTWQTSGTSQCSASPSLLVLVNSTR